MKILSAYRLAVPEPKAIGLALALTLCAVPAMAQQASTYISGFSWTTSTGADLFFDDPAQTLTATALNGGGLYGHDEKVSDTAFYAPALNFAQTSSAFASYSSPGDQTFFLTASAYRVSFPSGGQRNQATSTAQQTGMFSTSDGEAAIVTFTVNYILGVDKPFGNPISDFATTSVHFNAMSDDNSSGDDMIASLNSFDLLSGVGSKSGSFSFDVSLAAAQVGFYTLDGMAEAFAAPVPEPEQWALMAAGLLGLGAYVRKKKGVSA